MAKFLLPVATPFDAHQFPEPSRQEVARNQRSILCLSPINHLSPSRLLKKGLLASKNV
jgi:hypothetical protein